MNQRALQTLRSLRALRAAGVGTRPRKRMPKQRWPRLIEVEYAKAMISQLDRARGALSELFAKLVTLVEKARASRKVDRRDSMDVGCTVTQLLPLKYRIIDGVDTSVYYYPRYDAGESDELAAIMARVRNRLAQAVDPVSVKELAQKFAERTQSTQRVALGAQVKAALGADVFASDKKIPDIRDQFVGENVSLITSIPGNVVNEVEGLVSRAFTNATPHEELARQINERFNVGESRARLIARDQIGKLYGATNAYRQQELGITSFIWRTSGDERVRDEHAALEGEEFQYPEGAPEEGIPGEPIQCRCSAEPVFGDLLNASADDEEPAPENTPVPEKERPQAPDTSSRSFAPTHEERAVGRPQEIQQAQQRALQQRDEQERARVASEAAQAEHERLIEETRAAENAVNALVAQHHEELMQAHEGFRIGVSSEIAGAGFTPEVIPAVAPIASPVTHLGLPPPVTAPAFESVLPAPVSANVQLHIPAPAGFTGISHEGETFFKHNITGRAYTPDQLKEKQAGKGVVLHGPNEAPAGFEIIETHNDGDRYRSHATGNTYSLAEIASGYAAETDKLLITHENAMANAKKPGVLNRIARAILGR